MFNKNKGGDIMIQPIKQNLAFKGTSDVPPAFQKVAKSMPTLTLQGNLQTGETKQKKTIGQKFHNAKLGFMNFIKVEY